jgi:hypothetical protein
MPINGRYDETEASPLAERALIATESRLSSSSGEAIAVRGTAGSVGAARESPSAVIQGDGITSATSSDIADA